MIPSPQQALSVEDLEELYLRLKVRVERLEGTVRQFQAEHTRDALPRPTWTDVQALKKDIAALQKQIAAKRRK
jgi:hypothetical protein